MNKIEMKKSETPGAFGREGASEHNDVSVKIMKRRYRERPRDLISFKEWARFVYAKRSPLHNSCVCDWLFRKKIMRKRVA